MMKKLLLVVGLAVCMAGIASAELLDNGDFEAGAWNWAWSAVWSDNMAVTGGQDLTISGMARHLAGDNTLRAFISYEDAAGLRVDFNGDGISAVLGNGTAQNPYHPDRELLTWTTGSEWGAFSTDITVPEGLNVSQLNVTFSVEAAPGAVGVDELSIVSDKAHRPRPTGRDPVSTGLDVLEWDNPDPNDPGQPITCVVYYSTDYPEAGQHPDDPNFTDYAQSIPVNGDNLSAAIPEALILDRTYYWRVDCTDPSTGEMVIGYVWEFTTANAAPDVDAGTDVYTWLVDGERVLTIDATVTDEDGLPDPPAEYTLAWAVTGGEAGNIAITETDPVAEDAEVTVTALGTYELTLTADDSDKDASDTVTINVLEDACEAAKAAGVEVLVGDFNADCVVDIGDLMTLAGDWLSCISLDCM